MTFIFFIGEECIKSGLKSLSLTFDGIKNKDGAIRVETFWKTETGQHSLAVGGYLLV